MYLQLYTTHIETWLWYYQSMNLWIYGCTSTSTFCIYSWTMHRLCSLCTLTCWILCLDFIRKFKDCQWLSERLSVFSTLFTSVDFFQIPHTHWVRIFMVPLICISSRSRMQTFFASSLSSNATSGLILFQSDAGFRVTDSIRVATFTQGPTRLQLIFFRRCEEWDFLTSASSAFARPVDPWGLERSAEGRWRVSVSPSSTGKEFHKSPDCWKKQCSPHRWIITQAGFGD